MKRIKNVKELFQELKEIYNGAGTHNERVFALALAYLISEMCPEDRTTKHVLDKVKAKVG